MENRFGPKMSLEVQTEIYLKCQAMNHQLLVCTPASKNPKDSYLSVVLAQHTIRHDFTVWQYNSETKELFWGHYRHTLKQAMSKMADMLPEGI